MLTEVSLRNAEDLLRLADADLDALADRLHDGVLQTLVVARYACDAVVRGADPELARAAVQDALVALRHEVWSLRPRAESGLVAALEDLSAQRAGRPGQGPLQFALDADVATELPPAARALAYRLVQAVLVQAATTQTAMTQTAPPQTALPVRLTRAGPYASLEVDAPLAEPCGWALRAEALGGRLLAEPASTRLLLPLPISDDPSSDDPSSDDKDRL